ncbi:hypothetical protein [Pseudarthrobacter raffinosi]|uniref:hypothetical protein n=1 Tax=Pseudarthrobacter raffinosi TaxID=2953651 RepID=UPI00208F90F3|nr:hypothetical protein [Pseudarthrobacter sp. MDT3-9]MCO4253659.1 hypothetical protein [Pseudarthrobacter sp. MDT3-9]
MKTLDFRGFVGQKVDAKPELSHTEYIAVSGVLGLSRRIHPNDALSAAFRPVQEQFEAWLGNQGLALATRNLYATVSRTV